MSNDTALAVVQPREFSDRQLEIITNQIAKGASHDELQYFLEVCRLTGLNPLQRQIYAVMRSSKEKTGPGSNDWSTVQRMTIQTGIDGYRLIAARTGQLAGIDDPTYDTEDAEQPKWAKVTVWRFVSGHRVPFTATARWREYVQEKDVYENKQRTGRKEPSGMWAKMPYLMLGKCAEALALRKAFPAELSGVYTGEEMQQADHEEPQGYVEAAPFEPTPIRPHQPQPQTTAQPAPNPTFERWQALQPDEAPLRTAARYNGRWRQMFGHDKPFSDQERETFTAWLEREEGRRNAPQITEEPAGPEAEPVPFDLRGLDTGEIGA